MKPTIGQPLADHERRITELEKRKVIHDTSLVGGGVVGDPLKAVNTGSGGIGNVIHDQTMVGSGTVTYPLGINPNLTASIQSFSYTANGTEGTEFTVPLPVPMPTSAYLVVMGNASSGSMNYHTPASTRTSSSFTVSVSVPPANGEEFDFFLASQGTGGVALILSGGVGTAGLSAVVHDGTMTGDGTSTSPLSVTALSASIDGAIRRVPHELFGTGIDGDLVFDGSTTILGVTASAGGTLYKMNRDIMARNVTVNSGIRLWMANWALTVQETLTNNGSIENDGSDAVTPTDSQNNGPADGRFSRGKPGNGQNIGINSTNLPRAYFVAGAGGAANGGAGHVNAGDGGAGGAASGGQNGFNGGSTSLHTDNVILSLRDLYNGYYTVVSDVTAHIFLTYGASGGAGGLFSFNPSGLAGAGGGMLWVAAKVITGTGVMHARGGNGCAGGSSGLGNNGGGGGGGGGGMVVVVYDTISGQTIDANGGNPGVGVNGSFPGGAGGSGCVLKVNLSGDGTT